MLVPLVHGPVLTAPIEHWPVMGLQVPAARHALSAQTTGVPGWQTPAAVQVFSTPLQGLPSLHIAGTLVQVPTVPAALQAWQLPVHALLQHTPSTQLPDVQSVPAEQT